MTTKKPRSPQEKKSLSYAHDYRNTCNGSDKSIRTLIPLRKAGENRKVRRAANQTLQLADRIEEIEAEVLESSLRHDVARVGGWKKWEPVSLGEQVGHLRERREALGMTGLVLSDEDEA